MTTKAYQYTIFDKIKFGFSMLFQCFSCFHNIFEKFQFMAFAQQTCPNTIPFLYCPYCGDKVYALEEEPGGYNLLFTVDQSILSTLTVKMRGSNGSDYTILWGDNTLSTGILDGTLESFTHDYVDIGDYNFKIFIDDNNLLEFYVDNVNLKNTCPVFSQFSNLEIIYIRNNNLTGIFPPLSGLSSILNINAANNSFTGSLPDWSQIDSIEKINFRNSSFTGSITSLTNLTNLVFLLLQDNNLTGSLPDLLSNTLIVRFIVYNNNISGSVPDFGMNDVLEGYTAYENNISGNTPSMTNLISLCEFEFRDNNITGYTASIISLTCVNFIMNNNLLTQSAVDQILSDFNDNLALRPVSGKIYLHGTGNATPSAGGIVFKNNIIAHGWTVLTN